MRILFLESDQMWINGLPNGLRDIGHEAIISGPIKQEIVLDLIKTQQPDAVVTIGCTYETISEEKRKWMHQAIQATGVQHVYWDTEDISHFHNYTIPYIHEMQPDYVFTINQAKLAVLNKLGVKAFYFPFGYHPVMHHPVEPVERYRHQIALVANGYPNVLHRYPDHYRRKALEILVIPLVRAGMRVDFYGVEWNEAIKLLQLPIQDEWVHDWIPCPEAKQVYSSAHIMIGLQNEPNELTLRTREILASGGFLLTCDTPAIRRLGVSGHDFIASASPEETLKLVRHYLDNTEARQKIIEQAKITVQAHHYQCHAKRMIEILQTNINGVIVA